MLALASIVTYSVSSMGNWKKGREAAEKLRSVYLAQKSYLADQPSKSFATFTNDELIPYLPGNPGAMPSQIGLGGEVLTVNVTVMPPVFGVGSTPYDPSGATNDALWDVGGL